MTAVGEEDGDLFKGAGSLQECYHWGTVSSAREEPCIYPQEQSKPGPSHTATPLVHTHPTLGG
jgi:hypothetical protein